MIMIFFHGTTPENTYCDGCLRFKTCGPIPIEDVEEI